MRTKKYQKRNERNHCRSRLIWTSIKKRLENLWGFKKDQFNPSKSKQLRYQMRQENKDRLKKNYESKKEIEPFSWEDHRLRIGWKVKNKCSNNFENKWLNPIVDFPP